MKQRIRTLIVDNESSIPNNIRALLRKSAEFEIADECRDGNEAVRKIRKQTFDLVFLDVQMPGLGAFEVIDKVGVNLMPATILVSADEYSAYRAFSVQAIDYLVKPFSRECFDRALRHAETNVRRRRLDETSRNMFEFLENLHGTQSPVNQIEKIISAKPVYSTRLAVKSGEQIFLQNVDEIDWIEAEGDYIRLHVNSKSHLLRETMNALADKLDPKKFVRVHRSIIVNIEQVKDFQPLFKGEYIITLKDGKKLKTSRSYISEIRQILSR